MESHNNSPQASTSSSESPSNEKAPNAESSNLPTETKPDNTHIVTTEISTDVSGPSLCEMQIIETLNTQPATLNIKTEGTISVSARKKAASCFPASQVIPTDNQSLNKLISDLPQITMEAPFDLSNSSNGNMYSQASQESSVVFNERAIPGQKTTLQSELNKMREAEIGKEIGLSFLNEPADLILRKAQSEIPVKTELPNLELGQTQAQSVRNFGGYYDEEKKSSPFIKSPRDSPKIPYAQLKKVVRVGKGAYAKVYLMKDESNHKLFAIKKIGKDLLKKNYKEHQMLVEIEVLKRLNKSNRPIFTRFYGYDEDEEYLYLRLEYVNGGELAEYLNQQKVISKDQIRQFTAEIIDILECMHSCGVIHRDLKPENLLLTDTGHLKCIDFGGAKIVNGDSKISQIRRFTEVSYGDLNLSDMSPRPTFNGTPQYVSPEVLEDQECSYAADLWALGCIIYRMATGNMPFPDPEKKGPYYIFEKIRNVEIDYPQNMDSEIKDLIQKLLVREPSRRLGAGIKGSDNSYVTLKSHPFFKPFHIQKIEFKQISLKIPPENESIMAYIKDKKHKLELDKKPKNKQKSQSLMSSVKLRHEDIILSGSVLKSGGWMKIRKPRQLILYKDGLKYFDPDTGKEKGGIPLASIKMVDLDPKTNSIFTITIATRDYNFKIVQDHSAERWVKEINERRDRWR